MRKLTREPLVHFLLLGAGLFALYSWVGEQDGPPALEEIVITPGRIDHLAGSFKKTWQRFPTEQELEGLIREHIREEVLYREAVAMGLDRDDTIVRRRMRQKIEFLSEDIVSLDAPSDEDLQAFLAEHAEQFREETRFSFRQVYLDASKRGTAVEADALALMTELRRGKDASTTGDRLMVRHSFESVSEREVERTLGKEFLQSLRNTEVGSWQGPIVSGYGVHLVYISERVDGEIPDLAKIRDAVVREWSSARRREANEAFYETLRSRYNITIERPTQTNSPTLAMVEAAK